MAGKRKAADVSGNESDDSSFEVAPAAHESDAAASDDDGDDDDEEDDGFEVVSSSAGPLDANARWQQQQHISIVGPSVEYKAPNAMRALESTPFSAAAVAHLTSSGFGTPTPTQAQSWPIVLDKQDLISIAKTGSGKTLAYLLPSFHVLTAPKKHVQRTKKKYAFAVKPKDPRLVILVPTRELAMQIQSEAKKLLKPYPLRIVCIFGGASTKEQVEALDLHGVDVLVATPGRLRDFVSSGHLGLDKVEIAVLDEADKMLELGFEDQIRHLMKLLPATRQTLLFSATWPVAMQTLAANYMRLPVHVTIGSTSSPQLNRDIAQHFLICTSEADKMAKLKQALDIDASMKAIVFCRTKVECDKLATVYADPTVGCVHGDKLQSERTMTMNAFKKGTVMTLFATDVAARGLDVKDVGLVVNYDVPESIETFVHRVGRTGRAGERGVAVTLLTAYDITFARKVPAMLKAADMDIPKELIQLMRDVKVAPIRDVQPKAKKPKVPQPRKAKAKNKNKKVSSKKRRTLCL
ncbi:hypothetical protein SPRG_11914 [Saprolegnia parasitica CBS 223.65]|uniref:RNA helicase n=1 Tax=Saprolegnia parasitica (strain CBS 223.65) TaxID=695850 RepID=A0A067C8D0_SAPPC|nr:hypothetical protein SPRG_11914 [Saprolegnia parasitica CBS 223.65]KDO23067.1 hypothetical protein SPRG_11914 [Saprolegnia parasitica CBS 223.65]|eukprot:XP_012206183.1 hypothetical protein SPRG_11914 [Saprolegnia parasitica CBS 223.65]